LSHFYPLPFALGSLTGDPLLPARLVKISFHPYEVFIRSLLEFPRGLS